MRTPILAWLTSVAAFCGFLSATLFICALATGLQIFSNAAGVAMALCWYLVCTAWFLGIKQRPSSRGGSRWEPTDYRLRALLKPQDKADYSQLIAKDRTTEPMRPLPQGARPGGPKVPQQPVSMMTERKKG